MRVGASLFLHVSSFKVKVGPHIIEILFVAQIKETKVNSQIIFLRLTFSSKLLKQHEEGNDTYSSGSLKRTNA